MTALLRLSLAVLLHSLRRVRENAYHAQQNFYRLNPINSCVYFPSTGLNAGQTR